MIAALHEHPHFYLSQDPLSGVVPRVLPKPIHHLIIQADCNTTLGLWRRSEHRARSLYCFSVCSCIFLSIQWHHFHVCSTLVYASIMIEQNLVSIWASLIYLSKTTLITLTRDDPRGLIIYPPLIGRQYYWLTICLYNSVAWPLDGTLRLEISISR